MSNHYTLDGNRVRYLGSELLSLDNVRDFVAFSMRRQMRRYGDHTALLAELGKKGSIKYEWNLSRSRTWSADMTAGLSIRLEPNGFYTIECDGIERMNRHVVGRANRYIEHLAQRFDEENRRRANETERKRRFEAKRTRAQKRKAEQRARAKLNPAPIQERKPRKQRLAQSRKVAEFTDDLVPQLRKHHFFWKEAIAATVHIFGIKGDWKSTAAQVAARELHRSLDRHADDAPLKWATISRAGFTLMFVLPDGRWRGDITPLLIRSSKENKHRLYKRMRKYLRVRFGHFNTEERGVRREVMAQTNVIRFGGANYRAA